MYLDLPGFWMVPVAARMNGFKLYFFSNHLKSLKKNLHLSWYFYCPKNPTPRKIDLIYFNLLGGGYHCSRGYSIARFTKAF